MRAGGAGWRRRPSPRGRCATRAHGPGERPPWVRTDGRMPCASSRSSALACSAWSSASATSDSAAASCSRSARVASCSVEDRVDHALLGAVVEVAYHPAACVVAGRERPGRARRRARHGCRRSRSRSPASSVNCAMRELMSAGGGWPPAASRRSPNPKRGPRRGSALRSPSASPSSGQAPPWSRSHLPAGRLSDEASAAQHRSRGHCRLRGSGAFRPAICSPGLLRSATTVAVPSGS